MLPLMELEQRLQLSFKYPVLGLRPDELLKLPEQRALFASQRCTRA